MTEITTNAIERFEAAVRANHYRTCSDDTEREYQEAKTALTAALFALPIALEGNAPQGWQLVPVKPTMEMVKNAAGDHEGENWLPHSLWASMLAAAPVLHSSPGKDGGKEVESDLVSMREAAQDLIDQQKKEPQTVGYRLDLWRVLEATLEDEPPPAGTAPGLTNQQKEMILLHVIADMGGEVESSDSPYNWLNWFCSDEVHGKHSDTFNRCIENGWLRSTHNSDFDTSTTWLTPAGRAALVYNLDAITSSLSVKGA